MKTGRAPRKVDSLALALTTLGAFARLLPHPPNFSPVGGVSLFAGSRLRGLRAYLVPVLLMLATDPIMSAMAGYPAYSRTSVIIYASLLINVWMGRRWLQTPSAQRVIGIACLSSLQFFLLTNAATWLLGAMYPHNVAGLVAAYVAGLPFYGRTLASDMVYSGALFGLYAWIKRLSRSAATLPANTEVA